MAKIKTAGPPKLPVHPAHYRTEEGRWMLKELIRNGGGLTCSCGRELTESDIDFAGVMAGA